LVIDDRGINPEKGQGRRAGLAWVAPGSGVIM